MSPLASFQLQLRWTETHDAALYYCRGSGKVKINSNGFGSVSFNALNPPALCKACAASSVEIHFYATLSKQGSLAQRQSLQCNALL